MVALGSGRRSAISIGHNVESLVLHPTTCGRWQAEAGCRASLCGLRAHGWSLQVAVCCAMRAETGKPAALSASSMRWFHGRPSTLRISSEQ